MKEIFLDEVDSTNLYGKNFLNDLPDKTVIFAKRQTSGRGRLARSWVDLGGENLFLSFILKPADVFNEKFSNLTQYLSVILCEILESYGLDPQIKWPNDVLINGKKIAGILCETVMQGAVFNGLVLGIGVNLNSSLSDLETIDKPATSLNVEIGRQINLDIFKERLISAFFKDYDAFLDKGFEFIKSKYISHASFLDKEICVQTINKKNKGIAKALTEHGELILDSKGKILVLTIGEIL